jgi:endonuclease YncB( thermonuclease family)
MTPSRNLVRAALVVATCIGVWSCTAGPQPRPDAQPTPPVSVPRPAQVPQPERPPIRDQQPLLSGTVTRVMDGDTIEVQLSSGPIRVRLNSIDTPEMDQPWGSQARAALALLVNGKRVELEPVAQDRYDRLVAVVFVGGENVNAWMVQQGDAWAYRDYLEDPSYCAWEAVARASRLGLWSLPPGSRVAPWEWRAAGRGSNAGFTDYSSETTAGCAAAMHRRAAAPEAGMPLARGASPVAPQPGRCLIKGNISENGRIYHVPGSAYYDKTKIDESKGERWFCTEDQALEAGWRPPNY